VTSTAIREKLETVPERPGVYLFRGESGEPIYVGKAKSLRNRVRTYFQASSEQVPKTARLVAEIRDLEFIVVETEVEALILESNLIKRHRPRFNVILRDDKSYPYLKLSLVDEYPRLSLVRQAKLDRNRYYGPFIPTSVARRTLKLVPRFFRVATCNEVFDGKRRPCLYYHLDQCLAPCAGKTSPGEYGDAVRDARLFLEGRDRELIASLEGQMLEASESREYEKAARFRDTLRTVEKLGERQNVSSVGLEEQDYLAHHSEGNQAALQIFQMRGGKILGRREFGFDDVDPGKGSFYATVIAQYYVDADPPPEIYVAQEPDGRDVLESWLSSRIGKKVRIKVPVRGARRRCLDMARRNAEIAFAVRFRSAHTHGVEVLDALAEALGLDEPPMRIECFDVSNIQGSDSVASLVVWEGGKPKKADYRSYSIRSVSGPDDYASMAEAVTRRYRRLLAEEKRLPDLVLIDGGPGQLGAAVRSVAAVGLPMIPIVSLAKREEEIFLRGRGEPVRLDRSSPALRLVQRIRDEAHRFAITHHRRKRSKRTLRTALTEIPGIGEARARRLLRAFGSVRGVRSASVEDLARVVGPKLASELGRRFGEDGEAGQR
jgi:excinuclease ABC subunit C